MKKALCIFICAILMFVPVYASENSELTEYLSDWGTPVYEISEGFDSLTAGTGFMDDTALGQNWAASRGSGADGHNGSGVSDANGNYLRMGPFTQLVSRKQYTGRYLFECDYKSGNNQFVGLFVRSSGESFTTPAGGIPYFEDDKSGNESDGIGSTGLYIVPRGTKFRITVKVFDKDSPSTLNIKYVEIPAGVNFENAFHRISITDDTECIKIFIDGTLKATVEYSQRAQLDYLSEYESFTHAVIKGANGEELLTVDNARLCADFSVPAFAVRINEMFIDNISVKEYSPKAESQDKVIDNIIIKGDLPKTQFLIGEELDISDLYIEVTYDNKVKEDVKVTSDMLSAFDNTSLGAKLITLKYGSKSVSFTLYVVDEYGEEVTTSKIIESFETGAATKAPATQNGKPNTVIVISVCAAVLVVAVICSVIIFKKKR